MPTKLELKVRRSFTSGWQGFTSAGSQVKRAFSWPLASTDKRSAVEGAEVKVSVSSASSKLREAVRRNDREGVRAAVQSGARSAAQSFSTLGKRGTTALTIAATMPHLDPEIWNALIALGGLDEPMGTEPAHRLGMPRAHHGDRALHQAVRCGNLDGVSRLLAAGATSTLANTAGVTPGQLAFARWKAEPVDAVNQVLVGRLMPPHLFLAAVKHEVMPLPTNAIHGVISQLPLDVLSTLRADTAHELWPQLTPDQRERVEGLHRALTRGDYRTVQRLLSAGADRLVRNADGVTASRVAFEAFARAPWNPESRGAAIRLLTVEEFLDHLAGARPPVPAEHVRAAFDLLPREQLVGHPVQLRERLEPHLSDRQREISRHGDTELHTLIRRGNIDRLLQLRGSGPQGDMSVKNRDGMSASSLVLELLRRNPTDPLRRRMVTELVWADEIVDMVDRPGGHVPNDPLRSVIHEIPRQRLLTLTLDNLNKVWAHLSPEQQQWPGLKDRDSELHLAVRQGDLQTILKRERPADRTWVNDKEKMTPGQLAFSLLTARPQDDTLQQAVVELLPLPELARHIGASGLPSEAIGATVARVGRDALVKASAEQLSPLMPHLTPAQQQVLRDRDTELHLAARSGSLADVHRLQRIDGTLYANARGQTASHVAFERFKAHPDDADVGRIVTSLTWLPQLMDLVDQAGSFSPEQVARLVQTASPSAIHPLQPHDLNRFGRLLSPEQLREGLARNPGMGSWVRSLRIEQFNGFSSAQLEAMESAVDESQREALTLPAYGDNVPPAYQR